MCIAFWCVNWIIEKLTLLGCFEPGASWGGDGLARSSHIMRLNWRRQSTENICPESQVKQRNSEFRVLRKHLNLTLKWRRFGGGNKSFLPGDAKCRHSQFIVERKYFAPKFISLASLPNLGRARKGASLYEFGK